jgi:F-type H+-transporting ATPase subunit a
MATEEVLTPSRYMAHHLQNLTEPAQSGFWVVHVDTVLTTIFVAVITFGFLWLVTRRATAGVPGKKQSIVEMLLLAIDGQVKEIYHGASKWVAPIAATAFVLTFFANCMDFLPIDIVSAGTHHFSSEGFWRFVPTADANTTFALSLTVFCMMIYYSVKVKGLLGWIVELLTSPFGGKLKNPVGNAIVLIVLIPFNILMNIVEYVSRPLSHSLRLYGNMYAGELIFLLLGMWAANGIAGTIFSGVLGLGWAIFHLLIVTIQAYIFMMLTIVYISMAHEHH